MRCQETETDSAVTNGGGVPWDVGLEVNTNELHLESNAGSETADSPSRGRRKLGLLDALAQGDSRPRRALVSREVGVPNNEIRRIAHCHQTPAVGQGRTRAAQAPRRPAPEPRGAHNGDAAEGQRALGGALSRRRRRDARQDLSDQDAGAPVGAGDGDRRPTRRLDRSTSRPDHVRRVGNEYLTTIVHLRNITRGDYERQLRVHILPVFEDWPIAQIQQVDVRRFIAERRAARLAPKRSRRFAWSCGRSSRRHEDRVRSSPTRETASGSPGRRRRSRCSF